MVLIFFVLKTHTRVCVFAKSITIKAFKIKFTKKDGLKNPSFYFINLVLQFVSTIKTFYYNFAFAEPTRSRELVKFAYILAGTSMPSKDKPFLMILFVASVAYKRGS